MGALGEADIEAMYVDANEVDNIPGTNLVAVLPHGSAGTWTRSCRRWVRTHRSARWPRWRQPMLRT
ncbi:MAG: hypothetical protein R3C44_23275 [Chloroflexota bacterium]